MNYKKLFLSVAAAGVGLIVFGTKKSLSEVVETVEEIPEKCYAGIPLSELNNLAKSIQRGLGCSINDAGELIYHSKSNRGHQTLHTQMILDENNQLYSRGILYPGQRWSSAEAFAKRANEVFKFIIQDE